MPDARAWINSRHLRESAGGAAALAALDLLEAGLRDGLLERADEVAASSASLAHAWLPRAVAAAGHSAEALRTWDEAFIAVVGRSNLPRELASAFLQVDPEALAAWPAALRTAWVDHARALGQASRRLATAFVGATAEAVARGSAPGVAELAAWRHQADLMLAQGGWRAEFLAEAFVAGAGSLLGRTDAAAVAHWGALVSTLGSAGRNARPPVLPPALLAVGDRVLAAGLGLAAAAASHDPRASQRILDAVPSAVARLQEAEAAALLDAAAMVPAADALADALALLGGVLHGVPAGARAAMFAHARRLAGEAPAVLPAYLRTMDRAVEEGGLAGVEAWVERGLELAAGGAVDAAAAHFRLETRTAHKLLTARNAAVAFDEVEGMLRRYLTMMSRRTFQLVASPGLWMRPPLLAPEDVGLRLPERVDLFDASEDNQALYKVIASHVAGRFEYGTYDFRLDELAARGWAPPLPPDDDEAPRDVVGFLGCFPNPLLASSLFVLLEGIRVDACLARDFPGLRRDLERMGRLYAATTVPAAQDRHGEALLEALFHMGLGHAPASALEPRLRAQASTLEASVELLRSRDATVYDAAALTVACYGGLAFAQARALADDEEATFVEMGGATVVDPFEHLEGGERRENTAPWRPDPARAEPGEAASDVRLRLSDDDQPAGTGRPVSLEELRRLLERGGDLRISEAHGKVEGGLGLYITDLLGKVPAAEMKELREKLARGDAAGVQTWLARQAAGASTWYDEWDHRIADYRRRWCRVTEVRCDEDGGEAFADALARSGELVGRIKRDLQVLRPDQLRRVPRTEHGEEFDLNALVEAHSDRRGRRTPSDRLYVARKPEERDVATMFLVDMSASTDEPLPGGDGERRVIDLARDTLVVLAQVLAEIGDSYAICGFSGHGRENVEVYPVKGFGERLSDQVKARLGGLAPKRSTRMGAALRHAAEKLARTTARARHLILLSDGFPQDFDYGDDRRSNVYGIRDTLQALREIEKRGMQTFCITVDPAGHDYLGEMCPSSRYAVIDDIHELPSELVRIYRQVTRG